MLFEPRHRFAWVAAACFLLLCASLNSDSSSAAAASFPSQNGVENKNSQDENSAKPNIFTTPEMSALRHRGVDPEVNKGDDQGQFLFGGCPSEDVCGGRRLLFLFRRYSLCNAETEPAEICTLFPRRYLRRGYSCGACPTIDRCNSLESGLFFPGASFVSSHARGSIQVEWATEAFPYSLSQGDREEHCSDIRYHIILAPGQQNELLNVSRGINVTELLQDASSTNVNNVSVVQTSSPKGHVLENLPPHGNYTLLVVASANQQAIFSDPLTPSASVRVASMHPVLHPHVNRLVQLPTEGNLSVTLSGYVPDQVLVLTLQGRDGSSLPEEVNSLQAQDAVSGIAEGEAGSRQPFLVILDSLMITELEDGVFPTIAWYVRAAAISDVFQTLEFDTTHDLSRVVDPTDLDDESLSSTRRQRNRHLWTREKDLNTPFAPLELELPVPETPLSFKIPIQYSPDLNIRVELEPINLDKLLGDTLYVSVGGFEKWNYGFEINWELFNFDLLKNKPSWKDHTLFRHNIYIPTPVCTILLEGRIKTVGEIKFSGTVKVTAKYTEYMSRRQVFVLQFVGPFWFWGPKLMIPLVTMDEYGLVRSKLEDFTLSAEFELSGSFGIGYFVGPKFVSDYFNVGVMGALKLSIAVGHYSRYDFNDNSVEISPYVLDKFDLELVLELSAEFIKIKGKVTPFSYKLFSLPSIDEFITNHTLCPPNTNDAVSVQVTPSPDSVFEGLFFTIKPKEPFRWFYFGFSKNGWTIPWTTSGIEMKMSLPMSELENFELPSGTGFLRWTPEAIDFPLSRQSQFSLEEELFLVGHILDNLECCRDEDCPSAAEKCSGNRCTISGCSHNGHLGYCETNTENCPGLAAPGDDCPGGGGGNSYCCIGQTTRIQCSVAQGNTGSSASGFCLKRGAAEQQQCEFSISGASECAIYGGDTVCCVNRPNCKDNQGRPGSCVSLLSNQATNCKVPVSSVQWCESLEADASCCIHEDIECSYGDFKGECMRTSICGSEEYDGDPIRGLCPGGENIRCCLLDMPEESCISDNRYAGSCLGEEECNNLQMTPLDNFTNPRRDCTENKACCVEPPGCTSYHPTDDSKTVVGLCLHNESVCTLDSVSGLCPGRAPIQCCADLSLFYCSSGDPLDTREGRCQDKDLYCAGRVTKDECPGHSEIQCCLPPLEHEGYVAMGDSSSLPQPACFRLTDASAWRTGAVWSTSLLDVSQSFEISVELSFGIEDTTGADGIVFVLQTDGINALGEPGRDIGFKGIAPSLGVEFDTYENPPEQVAPEISADHVAIVWGGDLGNVMAGPSQIGADPTNIEDGDMHTARFVWDSVEEVFSIYFDGEQVILSNDVELYGYDLSMILGSQYAVWGFTSATGSYSNEHSVCIENLNAETEPLATWEKMGAAVNGSANGDDFGSSLAISSNGLVVAVGAMNFASPTNIGYVAVYQWDGSLWKPMGSRIDSLKSYDWLGFSVALSGDGTTLVTGGLAGDYLRVMRYVGSDWVEEAVLQPEPELGSTFFGLSLSISGDGDTIAVGETNVHPPNQSEGLHGMVRTYQRTGSVWSQIGSDIYGASSTDRCGQSVSLSFDGAVLATGCSQSGEGKGYVQTYFWLTGHWVRVWPNLEGDDMLDEFGGRVHLSDNGLTLAALAWDGRYAKVYEWDGIRWITKGSPILGLAGGFYQLSLSGDGSTVLAGTSPMALGDGYATAGWARVIRWTGTEWQQIGLPLQGSNTEQLSSNSISFDGNTVALGWSDQNNAEAPGHFQAYTLVD